MDLSDNRNRYDIEAAGEKPVHDPRDSFENIEDERAVQEEALIPGESWHEKAHRFAARFGVERRGIERVPSEERTDTAMSKIGTLWFSANMVVSSFAIGALAQPVFHLGFVDTILTILFINILGTLPVCFFSTFGPKFGLRQMVLSRFFFGYYPVKMIAFFNILACIGWAAVNTIVGAQLLNAVDPILLQGWAGIILIAGVTFLVTVFGYRIVHIYNRYSWIPCAIVFLFVLGAFGHSRQFKNIPMQAGKSEAGAVLSFAASVFGFATGWTSYAADYTVYQPVNSSSVSVFLWTFGGLIIPLLFTEMLGAAVSTATVHNLEYAEYYKTSGIGGLLAAVLVPAFGHFGGFCLIILALSTVANNCPNIYSVSLSLQVLAKWTARVPRFIWTGLGTLAYVAIAIPAYDHFATAMENFMLVIGYWLAIYEGISITEHFVFRRGFSGYDPETYTDPAELPVGLAAFSAFCFGIVGAVLGMNQKWFKGPVGVLFGGDLGFELAFGFSGLSFIFLRYWEKSHFRK